LPIFSFGSVGGWADGLPRDASRGVEEAAGGTVGTDLGHPDDGRGGELERRPDRARDRPCLPGAGDHDGFLVFNEGYLATGPGTDPARHDLTAEAIRLTRLIRALMPDDGEVAGLLALMLLTDAGRTARVSASGELVTLGEQDRGPGTRR
jgi:Family of unknown function (DUF6596)